MASGDADQTELSTAVGRIEAVTTRTAEDVRDLTRSMAVLTTQVGDLKTASALQQQELANQATRVTSLEASRDEQRKGASWRAWSSPAASIASLVALILAAYTAITGHPTTTP